MPHHETPATPTTASCAVYIVSLLRHLARSSEISISTMNQPEPGGPTWASIRIDGDPREYRMIVGPCDRMPEPPSPLPVSPADAPASRDGTLLAALDRVQAARTALENIQASANRSLTDVAVARLAVIEAVRAFETRLSIATGMRLAAVVGSAAA